MEDSQVRIVWIWIYERGGEDVAQVSFEFTGTTDTADTVTFSVAVPMKALLSVNRFCSVLLQNRLDLTGSEKPQDLYEVDRLDRIIRALENVHPRIWLNMVRAARIHSANAVLDNRIHSWMCGNGQDPSGDDAA
ncbi:hypothetical protein [Dongia deserti]|uniref:hypothetical protein n=1 Tax=Dongia deserti TaxID=2268030 RepID=UPI000E65934A|nr:hypothetical protein [Dongia deserti]